MKIVKVEAIPIKLVRDAEIDENRTGQNLHDFGDYVIATDSWTSIYPKHLETTLVRIETDTGLVGWGEAFSPVARRTTQTIVEDLCRTVIMGQNPEDVEYLWYRTYSAMRERGHGTGFYVDALSGVDQALWDILGKAANRPLHRLTGGRVRDRVKVYAGIGGGDAGEVTAKAEKLAALGYRALKLHLRLDNPMILDVVASVRAAVGDGVELMVDVHTTLDVSGAIVLGRGLERLGVRWLEAPVAPEDVDGHAEVTRALDMQVASGEWLRTAWEWRPWLEKRAVDCPMPDIGRTGISEGKRIVQLCDAFHMPVAPHVGAGCVLAIAAGVQLSASTPRFQILEHSHEAMALKCSFATHHPKVENGYFVVDDSPGLGVEIDERAVERIAG